MSLPSFLQSALWSYDISKLDRKKDRDLIITQIFNHGTWSQVLWVLDNYSREEIRKVVKKPERGLWHKDALNFWTEIFDIKLSKKNNQASCFFFKHYVLMHPEILNSQQRKIFPKLNFLTKENLYLAGGTAPALQLGHRRSIDFDFYSSKHFKKGKFISLFRKYLKNDKIEVLRDFDDTFEMRKGSLQIAFL